MRKSGGLIAYGDDYAEEFRQAAGYIDRILKGAKASRSASPEFGDGQAERLGGLEIDDQLEPLRISFLVRADEVFD